MHEPSTQLPVEPDIDSIILETLARRVRLATTEQLTAVVQILADKNVTERQVRNRLRRLKQSQDITQRRVALKVFEVVDPLFRWRPGDPFTEADAIAWSAARRIAGTSPRVCTLYRVTQKGARLHGAGGVTPRRQPTQMEHDLGCTAMLIAKLRHDRNVSDRWTGEDEIRRYFQPLHPILFRKIPDAALIQENDQVERFLEYCGQYSAKRILRFHRHCQRHRMPYELY